MKLEMERQERERESIARGENAISVTLRSKPVNGHLGKEEPADRN